MGVEVGRAGTVQDGYMGGFGGVNVEGDVYESG